MKSPNFTVFLLVGYYLGLFWFQRDFLDHVGSKVAFLSACAAFFPVILVLRKRFFTAVSLTIMTLLFSVTMLLIQQTTVSLEGLRSMLSDQPVPVIVYLVFLLPGLFMVSELDPERLPHELSHWSGLRVFRPLVAVLAGRERILRRIATIRDTCEMRGIELKSRSQHLWKFYIWFVPLASATICEAAYAYKFREMLGSAHRFVPTKPIKPVFSPNQKLSLTLLILVWFLGIQRFARIWKITS